ncbi:hypothetical protein DPMN_175105 [Dreissena polymorpha]|uniref:Uncharacterized protein n=1 Tax=Dreissena polymorpha TaxID=45954 RepID=A0A9D4IIF2_DREPO|nr:hypothetical protein DPMN_175105 [Dreissena polymorpha]
MHEAILTFENGKAVFMEISNVNTTWNNSAVYFTFNKEELYMVVLQIKGEDFTCSWDGQMLAMWIGSENVKIEQIINTNNDEKQYRPSHFSITKHHHNKLETLIKQCLEQGPPSAPTYVEFSAYKADVTEYGNITTEVTEYGNIYITERHQES